MADGADVDERGPNAETALMAAALAGKIDGADGSTIRIRSAVADDKERIVAAVDGDGNRTAITVDLS